MSIDHTRELLCFAIGDYADKMALKVTELIMHGAQHDAEDMAQAFTDMVASAADTLDRLERKRAARAGVPAAPTAPAAVPVPAVLQQPSAPEASPATPDAPSTMTDEEADATLRQARVSDMTDEEADEVLRNARNFGIDRGLLADEIVFPSDGMEEVPPTVQFSSLHSDSPEFSQAGQFMVPLSPIARIFAEQDDETAARPHSKLPRAVGVVRTEDPASEMPPQA